MIGSEQDTSVCTAGSVFAPQLSTRCCSLRQLTAQGRHELNVLVATLTVTRDVHAVFLQAHQQVLQEPR